LINKASERSLTMCREIRRALWAGIATDAVDIGSVALGFAMGHYGKTTGVLLGAVAVGSLAMGVVGLRGL
jgi:hypothetical protein